MLTWAICRMTQSIYKEAIRNGRAISGEIGGFTLILSIAGDIFIAFAVFATVATLAGA